MESLLLLSFENISSKEPTKIRKGLRQIEGLLAQICLSQASSQPSTPSKRNSSAIKTSPAATAKTLRDLNADPAFREFWRLQESFEWNVPTRLLPTLTTLLSLPTNCPPPLGHACTTINPLLAHALSLLHALLLLHPPSRSLFSTPINMTLLLDLLDPSDANDPAVQSAALLALVTALIGAPRNARCFEKVGGLEMVTSLLRPAGSITTAKGRGAGGSGGRRDAHGRAAEVSKEVRLKVLEFLYFYLMPETLSDNDDFWGGGGGDNASRDRGGRKDSAERSSGKDGKGAAGSGKSNKNVGEEDTRTSREKQKLLGRYLNNVGDLVQDLRESAPFGQVSAC